MWFSESLFVIKAKLNKGICVSVAARWTGFAWFNAHAHTSMCSCTFAQPCLKPWLITEGSQTTQTGRVFLCLFAVAKTHHWWHWVMCVSVYMLAICTKKNKKRETTHNTRFVSVNISALAPSKWLFCRICVLLQSLMCFLDSLFVKGNLFTSREGSLRRIRR